ncbi:MAG TPA: aldehyde dehydrogenase family protein, partial [Xanthomonadales bacterium]|nr:aldehyde dehydrogenase family protein [Xanthomonadales bacterium]
MSNSDNTHWHEQAGKLDIEGRAFIDGRFMDALDGQTRSSINPANGQTLAEVALCGTEDADRAVAGARKAFERGHWSGMAPDARRQVLVRWAELVERDAEELALLETLDVGKPISDTLKVDVPSAVRTLRWSGEAIDKFYGQIAPTPADSLALVQRLPLGVVAAIVPWNFPLSTTAWKLAPALATGNSVVLKPASNTPLSALKLAQLAAEAGLPEGVLQVLPGPGGSLGKHLATHMDIDGLTFTGSTPVGKLLMQYAGQSNL